MKINILIFLILTCNILKAQNTDTFVYQPFYPIAFNYNKFDLSISTKDSIYLKKFIDYIVDSTYFLSNGFFVIQTLSSNIEKDSIACIDYVRISKIQKIILDLIESRIGFPKVTYNVNIYSNTYLSTSTSNDDFLANCQIWMQFYPNYNRLRILKNK